MTQQVDEKKPISWRELPTLQISRGEAPSPLSKVAARQMAFNVRSVETVAAELEKLQARDLQAPQEQEIDMAESGASRLPLSPLN